MKMIKMALVTSLLLGASASVAGPIRGDGSSTVGVGPGQMRAAGFYWCNKTDVASKDIDNLKKFRQIAVSMTPEQFVILLFRNIDGPSDPLVTLPLVEEAVNFAKINRASGDQGDAFVNEFTNSDSVENCSRLSELRVRIKDYMRLLSSN